MTYNTMLWWLLIGHVLADFPLQGDFLSDTKNHKRPIPGMPWQLCLAAHALIHGGMVAYVTQDIELGMCETLAHGLIDHMRCDGKYGMWVDQSLHLLCKVFWVWIWFLDGGVSAHLAIQTASMFLLGSSV